MSNRTRVYRALREAGPDGLTRARLREIVGASVTPHIESLRAEGLAIADVSTRRPRGLEWGWELRERAPDQAAA